MKEPLYKFLDNQGTFFFNNPHRFNTLYFPLCNLAPILSSVTPTLGGDIKTDNNSFLLEPASRISLSNSKISRNFWVLTPKNNPWSATGVSKDTRALNNDFCTLEAGLLWHKVTRKNALIGLASEVTSFVPATGEPTEIMRVKITNISRKKISLAACAAIPIFARSANSLRDHRHVTSLLQRTTLSKYGVTVTPTLLFDETGHHQNRVSYFVLGYDQNKLGPQHIYPSQEEFCGEGGDLENPQAIFEDGRLPSGKSLPGQEAMGALRFKKITLAPGKSQTYLLLMGIVDDRKLILSLAQKFNTPQKVEHALEYTKKFWQEKSSKVAIESQDPDFDNWFRWVSIQPLLRKIFGCSFLPDFDYGRGGRGWRDLWQDALSLMLTNPEDARWLLLNNFKGVRVDGSNATIIGSSRGQFIADRNNISRVWMDHGVWPVVTTLLYLHQTQDEKILFEKVGYFRDRQLWRSRKQDFTFGGKEAPILKNSRGKPYLGTVLEHMLVQTLVQFFNVGEHNIIRLEGGDWNDGLDMGAERGESVAFSCLYAYNLGLLAETMENLAHKNVELFPELKILLDTVTGKPVSYDNIRAKQKRLEAYFARTQNYVGAKTITIPKEKLCRDLRLKSEWLTSHIRKQEWLSAGFFNGYYDNRGRRVEGKAREARGKVRITLAGQTFPLMSGAATHAQLKSLVTNVRRYLWDPKLKGFRLNSDFKEAQPALGRAFSFAYGEKENGAFFSHMAVMYAYALYGRGLVQEGFKVLDSLYRMSANTGLSKIYPGLPEYFNNQGRGMYCYLTGSASWYVLTMLTQVFGIRGIYGDLLIFPKLCAAQFSKTDTLSVQAYFAGRRIEVKFLNRQKKEWGHYAISSVRLNGRIIDSDLNQRSFCMSRQQFLRLATFPKNIFEVTLK